MKKLTFILALSAVFIACEKEETSPDNSTTTTNPTNNNGSGGGGGFTIPTSSYWQINDSANSSSMDAVSVNIAATTMGVSKPFSKLGYGYCQLRVFSNNNSLNIRTDVAEGSFKIYPITISEGSSTGDSLRVEVDVEDQNSATSGNYFYRATGGKVYVSKKNGKLRFTSASKLSMTGLKYPDMQNYIHTANTNFSQEEL